MPETKLLNSVKYCNSLTIYSRRETRVIDIGDVPLGGINPIRLQSMTIVDTMDTTGSIDQVIRMVEAGSEYVRITAPSLRAARNLKNIKEGLATRDCHVPLIADIHFLPNAAEEAARIVEKVRINPGNYADKKKFQDLEYTDESYNQELERIRERFTPLVKICKEYGTAMRIGTNHGSLSDRIMSRYGDTPTGMVESALEFLRICEDLNYYDIVLSMKASNTHVMVQAYRLLVNKLDAEGFKPYPLHLGVTEAGEGEDGRIKSALGIGTLLEDGLGDTVRVSLTEEPEFEIPVARTLVQRYKGRISHNEIEHIEIAPGDPFSYTIRETREIVNFGGKNVPRVIADYSMNDDIDVKDLKAIGHFYLPEPDKWRMNDDGADFIYSGKRRIKFMLPNGLKEIIDFDSWENDRNQICYPLFTSDQYLQSSAKHPSLNFVSITPRKLQLALDLKNDSTIVWILETKNIHAMADLRQFFFGLEKHGVKAPVVIKRNYDLMDFEKVQLFSATDFGGILIDGFGDGIMLTNKEHKITDQIDPLDKIKKINQTAFGVLQAARTRISKTEFISCPSCGRTLFDLQETTAMIRKQTDHLKGVKIGIMGCIVNGPGEMADADYGYVGSGKDRITLYKGKEIVKKGVHSDDAVDELITIIKNDGRWLEPHHRN